MLLLDASRKILKIGMRIKTVIVELSVWEQIRFSNACFTDNKLDYFFSELIVFELKYIFHCLQEL